MNGTELIKEYPEEEIHRDLVELVWDPEEGIVTTSPYTEPREPEYEMRVVDGVQTPFLTEVALLERWANYHGFYRVTETDFNPKRTHAEVQFTDESFFW